MRLSQFQSFIKKKSWKAEFLSSYTYIYPSDFVLLLCYLYSSNNPQHYYIVSFKSLFYNTLINHNNNKTTSRYTISNMFSHLDNWLVFSFLFRFPHPQMLKTTVGYPNQNAKSGIRSCGNSHHLQSEPTKPTDRLLSLYPYHLCVLHPPETNRILFSVSFSLSISLLVLNSGINAIRRLHTND